jgi:2-keto-3-deoxy-L-rhamnonate aldolase RhmA
MVVATLETPLGIENADVIASIPGVDALLIGGNDLCLEMGIPGRFHDDRVVKAVERVVAACAAHGKHPGLGGIYQPDLMKRYIGLGMRLILCGSDIALLMSAARERADFARSCM